MGQKVPTCLSVHNFHYCDLCGANRPHVFHSTNRYRWRKGSNLKGIIEMWWLWSCITFCASWRSLLALPSFRILIVLLKFGHMPMWIALLDNAHLCKLFPSSSVASLPADTIVSKNNEVETVEDTIERQKLQWSYQQPSWLPTRVLVHHEVLAISQLGMNP